MATLLRERWPDAPPHAIEAAWLHDVVQNVGVPAACLLREGISPEAVWMVEALARPVEMTELDWASELAASANLWAIRIKLADYAHTSAPARARLEAAERMHRETGMF